MRVSFSIYDYAVIILYFAISIVIGLRVKSADKTNEGYLVASRRITLPAFVATLVSTFYGGILGVGEFTYNYGFSSWIMNAFPYYFFITIFAFFLAKKIRKSSLYTIPDKLDLVYGKEVSILGAFLVFLLVTPAPYLLMLGIILQVITGWSIQVSILVCLLLSIVYLFKGGLKADVNVNIFEFVMMYVGFAVILPFCFSKIGGFGVLADKLPAGHLTLTGDNSLSYILVWFLIGSWSLVDPTFHQRCYAAESQSTAKKGVLISLMFWFIFDFFTITVGLYARVFLPDLKEPPMAYPLLADSILPIIIKGVFFTGMIATVMSTLHSYIFVSATTFGNDIVSRIRNQKDVLNRFSKIGIIVTAIISLIISFYFPSVVQIWYLIGTLCIPPLLISIITSYFEKLQVKSFYIFSSMLASFIISLSSFLIGQFNMVDGNPVYPNGWEPMYPGLIAGLGIYFIGLLGKNLNKAKV
ncbi:MAG: sodium:solute symporter family protein [Bacteroidetes bacterium]|nr:sodium:solute symporter family protein [Bacteroidota bacterium]